MCRVNFDMSVKLSSIPTYYSTLQLLSSTLGNPIFMTSYFSSLVISLLFASHLISSPLGFFSSTLSRTIFLQTILCFYTLLSSLFFWWYLRRVEETWSLHFWMPESEFWNVTPLFFTYWIFHIEHWSKTVSDETKKSFNCFLERKWKF